jgi:hypothetical protein
MALQIAIQYQDHPLTYEINVQEEDVYIFRLNEQPNVNGKYVPEKLVIRRKGKLWVSDLEDHEELVTSLIKEIDNINMNNNTNHKKRGGL